MPVPKNDNVLVGFEYKDDAGVYKISNDSCLIQTVDFFTPVVDDPYTFGQIAAANALSDVYAMGGKPITALNIACFPVKETEKKVFNLILLGGLDKINEAGAALLGGHSIDDKELKYGLSVTGVCNINEIYSNKGASPGDILYLTKSLGTGFVVSAICTDFLSADSLNEASLSMSKLNKRASEIAVSLKSPNALTDVTGFGLIGHLSEMMLASGAACEVDLSSLPAINGVYELIRKGINPAGTKRNRKYFSKYVSTSKNVDENLLWLAFGAETSGGLVMPVPESKSDALELAFKNAEEPLRRIGKVLQKEHDKGTLIYLF
ncbi:MAG: selenide, water dikinase SelD [Deltaproteobacteria bacterium]|nr:selenide, water dikinase SelD [Deltaproteobacteria bacterium]MCL5880924.1 selenide, water dikinase SelD [Deltaproteobacteria bacterium]